MKSQDAISLQQIIAEITPTIKCGLNRKMHRYWSLLLKDDRRVTGKVQVRVPHIQLLYGPLYKTQDR